MEIVRKLEQLTRDHPLPTKKKKGKSVKDFHSHKLTLCTIPDNKNRDEDLKKKCEACLVNISWLGPHYYECIHCSFYLHRSCADEAPAEIPHHRLHPHPDHPPLTLSNYYINCSSCRLSHWVSYSCSQCKFSLCFRCAMLLERNIRHPSHPHPLSAISRPVLAMCDACGFKHEATFYHCMICGEYCIHEKSIYSRTSIFIQDTTSRHYHHDHPLHLAFSLPPEISSVRPKCDVCEKEFKPRQWLYRCGKEECKNYFIHYSCASGEQLVEPFMSIFLPPSKPSLPSANPEVPCLPFSEHSHSIVCHRSKCYKDAFDSLFVTITATLRRYIKGGSSDIHQLSSPHYHYPNKKIKPICFVCLKPIEKTEFHCQDQVICHDWCATLKLRGHPSSSVDDFHRLRLVKKGAGELIDGSSFGLFRCHVCDSKFNGLAFKCEICHTYFDPTCCSLPSSIVHEAHPAHILYLSTPLPSHISPCRACSHQPNEKYEFRCAVCNFKLHIGCALLPGKVYHRYDNHPLALTLSPPTLPPRHRKAEYFCEICEEEVDAKEWFYYCAECDQAMHPGCGSLYDCSQSPHANTFVHHFDPSAKIKFGGVLNVEGHQHPLFFVRSIERNKTTAKCAKCGEGFKTFGECDIGFACLQCSDYALHHRCALPPESNKETILVSCSDYKYSEYHECYMVKRDLEDLMA